jgi:glyoxylase-like metal-dependent hydrolase (beta-lactamase superfamily II)
LPTITSGYSTTAIAPSIRENLSSDRSTHARYLELAAILVTQDDADHVGGVGALWSKLRA